MKKIIAILVILVFITSICFADLSDNLPGAVEDGDLIEVERLLEEGADVNLQDEWGITALLMAVKKGYTEIVEIPINAGAVE